MAKGLAPKIGSDAKKGLAPPCLAPKMPSDAKVGPFDAKIAGPCTKNGMSEYNQRQPRYPTKLLLILGTKDQKNKEDLFMGKLGFTPIIGLAVVVALAMAAVFGAMSLTNPAFAAVGRPGRCRIGREGVSPSSCRYFKGS